MKTEILQIDRNNVDIDKIKYAAYVLKSGGIVVFPTETVYGLGANGLLEDAVNKVFVAKGRPADNPLILHVASELEIRDLVSYIPDFSKKLIAEFWPGPLTLIFKKSTIVPNIITAGLDTVAIRMPSDTIANLLIKEAGVPIAAPSANISGRPSGTDAKHVIEDLSGKVDLILDAGDSKVGLESTVLDVTVNPPILLRPGAVTPEQITEVTGDIIIDRVESIGLNKGVPRSPGMKYKHYSPKADVHVINGELSAVKEKICKMHLYFQDQGLKVGVLATKQTIKSYQLTNTISMGDRNNPATIANSLFRCLRDLDEKQVDIILVEAVDDCGIGFAIMNRLIKASGNKIINV